MTPPTALTANPSHPWRAELAATLRLSWPLALANLLQMLIYAVDVMFIARLGEAPLAAAALATAYFGLVLWVLSGLTGAIAPLAAAELGARAPALRPVRRTVRMALWLAVVLGAAGMGLCYLAEDVMRLTGQDPAVSALADRYMTMLVWSLVPMIVASVLRNFVAALGRPGFATLIAASGIGVNALGNYAFVFGNLGAPALGLTGAALATIVTAVASVLAYLVMIAATPSLRRYHILSNWWRADGERFARILRVGAPIAMTILAEGGVFGAAAFMMGRIGPAELAAHTVALQLAALAFQVPFGIGQAAAIRVGLFHGAANASGIARAGWTALALGTGFMACTALIMLAFPKLLLSIYVDVDLPANAAMVSFALTYLSVAAAFQLFDGVQAVAAGALRGLQDTRIPMWIAIFAYWGPGFGLAMALGFGTGLSGLGVWIGLAVGLVAAAALLVWRWRWRKALGLVPHSHHVDEKILNPPG